MLWGICIPVGDKNLSSLETCNAGAIFDGGGMVFE